MIKRLIALVQKEFKQLRRNPLILRMVVLLPVMQLAIFGYAAVLEVNNINIAILDKDNSQWSRELRGTFESSNYFVLQPDLKTENDVPTLFNKNKIQLAVIIPPDFGRKIEKGEKATVQLLLDGTNSSVANAAAGYSSGCIAAMNSRVISSRTGNSSQSTGITVENRFLYNPSLNNKFFFIPGVFAMIVMVIGMPVTAMSIVREKEEGTYEQLVVTPIGPIELILGKVIPYTILILIASTILLLISLFWFGLPLRGSLFMLYLGILLFLLNVLGLGIFVSTISNNQQQAMLTSFFILMPAILFSGFMFPIDNMPPFFKGFAHINPMTHFLYLARHIFLKGSDWLDVMKYISALTISGVIIFGTSMSMVRKRAN